MGLFSKKTTDDKKDKVKDEPKKEVRKEVKADESKPSMKDLYDGGKTVQKAGGKKEKAERKFGNAHRILIKPLITEKASVGGSLNKYFFAVSLSANKIEIAKAVNEVYGIKPVNVNIINVKGKEVRYGRQFGKRKDWKKAVVTLPAGKTINLYEGV